MSPESIDCVSGNRALPEGLDDTVATALALDEVRRLVSFEHGGPLTADDIRRLSGGAVARA
jgi:hypothetical protein